MNELGSARLAARAFVVATAVGLGAAVVGVGWTLTDALGPCGELSAFGESSCTPRERLLFSLTMLAWPAVGAALAGAAFAYVLRPVWPLGVALGAASIPVALYLDHAVGLAGSAAAVALVAAACVSFLAAALASERLTPRAPTGSAPTFR